MNLPNKQSELAAEFAKYVVDRPEIDDLLPEDGYVFFQIDGNDEFNEYSQQLAVRRRDEEGMTVVCASVQGLAPPQGSRLIDPQITPAPSFA